MDLRRRGTGGARRFPALVTLVPLMATGCLLFKPSPGLEEVAREAVPEGAKPPSKWVSESSDGGLVENDWLATFNDPGLVEIVRQAMAHNPDIAAVASRVQRAEQVAQKVGAQLVPTVGVNASVSGTYNFDKPAPFASFGAVLAVAWEADIWGKLTSEKESALASARATEMDYAAGRQLLAAATARNWYAATEMLQLVSLGRHGVSVYKQLVVLVEAKAAAGKVGQLEISEASARLHEAESQLVHAEASYAEALRSLEVLAGRYPAAAVAVNADFVAVPPPIPAGLPASLLQRRPDLIAAGRRVQAAFQGVQAAKLALLPSFSLTTAGGVLDDPLLSVLNENPTFVTLGLKLLAPIFDGGQLRAKVGIADAAQREAIALFGRAALESFKEVETALANEVFIAHGLAALQKAAAERSEAVRIARDKLEAGSIDLLPVLQLQADELTVDGEVIQLRGAQLANRIQLHLVLGGGFEARPAAELPTAPTASGSR